MSLTERVLNRLGSGKRGHLGYIAIRLDASISMVMMKVYASKESKPPIQKERESVVGRKTAEQPSVPETPVQPSVLEAEVMLAVEASEESESPI
jgi:hypothetical protein